MKRISSIDIARGIAMIIMPLDHARDFLHGWSFTHNPLDLSLTTPLIFMTRWITHFCAPAFVFLSGVSAALALSAAQNKSAGRRYLLQRGILLVVIEFTLVGFGLSFDPHFRLFIFEVIATIGAGLILVSFLSRLPRGVVLALALLLIFGHDLMTPAAMMAPDPNAGAVPVAYRFIKTLLWSLNGFQVTPKVLFVVAYPILPWLGIMLAGFAVAPVFQKAEGQRRKVFFGLGLLSLGLFILLRCLNSYGDPANWSAREDGVFTFLSFLNVSKYPPSLLFTLSMLSLLFFVLAAVEGMNTRVTRVLQVYGRTPLFYFIVHMYLVHATLLMVLLLQGFHLSEMQFGPMQFGRPEKGGGLSLAWVYVVWVGVVVLLYPVCRWYGRYKADHPEKKILRYL